MQQVIGQSVQERRHVTRVLIHSWELNITLILSQLDVSWTLLEELTLLLTCSGRRLHYQIYSSAADQPSS